MSLINRRIPARAPRYRSTQDLRKTQSQGARGTHVLLARKGHMKKLLAEGAHTRRGTVARKANSPTFPLRECECLRQGSVRRVRPARARSGCRRLAPTAHRSNAARPGKTLFIVYLCDRTVCSEAHFERCSQPFSHPSQVSWRPPSTGITAPVVKRKCDAAATTAAATSSGCARRFSGVRLACSSRQALSMR